MAEREGFEPSDQLPSRILSKDVHSATLPSLRLNKANRSSMLMAEREGFEPPAPRGAPDFESGTFGHSVISPYNQ